MSQFKLEFTLRQHTPIIHFQADQKGATLRATELKPKLDRFLIEHVFKNNFEKYKEFLIGYDEKKEQTKNSFGGKLAFDYKVKIICNDTIVEPIEYHKKKWDNNKNQHVPHNDKDDKPVTTTLPTFFANMGEEWEKTPKSLVFSKKPIEITIQSFHSKLLDSLKVSFEKFIFRHNFGMRQSKGFGSFSLIEINGNKITPCEFGNYKFNISLHTGITKHTKQINNKYIEEPTKYFIELFELFSHIHRFHQTIRSGINEGGLYFKPFSFSFAKKGQIHWDKRMFKQKFLSKTTVDAQIKKHQSNNHEPLGYIGKNKNNILIRDLLGLSTMQIWRAPRRDEYKGYGFTLRHPKDKEHFPDDYYFKDKRKELITSNDITRFKSPITYKPIKREKNEYDVYIILDQDCVKQLLEKDFKLTIVKEFNQISGHIEKAEFWRDFDLNDFFQFILQNKDNLDNQLSSRKNTLEKSKNDKIFTDYIEPIYNTFCEVSYATN